MTDARKMIQGFYEKETDPEKKELLKFDWALTLGGRHGPVITQRNLTNQFSFMATNCGQSLFIWNVPNRPEVCQERGLLGPEATRNMRAVPSASATPTLVPSASATRNFPKKLSVVSRFEENMDRFPHSGFGMGN